MNKEFKSVKIFTQQKQFDTIGALISVYNIDSLLETEEALVIYYGDDLNEVAFKPYLESLSVKFNFKYEFELIPLSNWNKDWEAGFSPIYVDDFVCIHADFHKELKATAHRIEINPKMSFGTGHHETTFMMMAAMKNLALQNKQVLDLGCGTSVLAILAEKLNAKPIYAIDYDELCYNNSEENLKANNCQDIELALGVLDDVVAKNYDVVLANINRGVLMTIADQLHQHMVLGASLLISGILETDKDLVVNNYVSASFRLEEINQKGEWLCILFTSI